MNDDSHYNRIEAFGSDELLDVSISRLLDVSSVLLVGGLLDVNISRPLDVSSVLLVGGLLDVSISRPLDRAV